MTRLSRRLLAGAIAILVPALAGCEAGLNAPTLAFHPASSGVSTVADGIRLNNVFVLGPALGATLPAGGQAGVFLSLVAPDSDRLVSVSAPGTASSVQLTGGPVTLSPHTVVNLSGPDPSVVLSGLTSPLSGGETVLLQLTFASAGTVTLDVPVMPAAYDFATFAQPPSPSASTTARHKHKAKAGTGTFGPTPPPAPASPSATS